MIDSIARRRLRNLQLPPNAAGGIEEVVTALGAVQAQDFAAATWAVGTRVRGATASEVGRAFDAGRLVRTHVMRPTWHFVAPATIGWLLELTAPRVHQACAGRYRELGLDPATRRRALQVMRRQLRGGAFLTRHEIAASLARAGIDTGGQRLPYLLLAGELDAVICSGPRRGRHLTYALFDERVPAAPRLDRDRAVAELARRYITTHGPATVRDFAWWSGLTVATARAAVEMLGRSLESETVGRHTYWSRPPDRQARRVATVHLLPAFDEYIVAYRDREAVPYRWPGSSPGRHHMNPIVIDGAVAGSWRRASASRGQAVEAVGIRSLDGAHERQLQSAVRRYARFLEGTVVLVATRA